MLSASDAPRVRVVEKFNPEDRFECWSVAEAQRLGDDPASFEGYAAGYHGAPCPGPSRSDAFRMGWEMGAIHAYRVPVPAWMIACNRQAESECVGSA